jgi:predicted unusual protein kinase regulating ubiquinone biosynthesis (AarF/ABC1/UbiB family)
MGKLRGLPQKIGQMLSMSADDVKAEAFAPLTDHAEPLALADIEAILREEWGRDPRQIYSFVEPIGLAASLGQVHRAHLRDGREVAIKVQYPGIRQAVMNDLKMLGWLSAPVGDLRRGFDLTGYRQEILRDLEAELDYRVEAENQARFGSIGRELPGWIIPELIPAHCTQRVLVSRWVVGDRIEEAAAWPQLQRDQLAAALVRGFFNLLFGHGLIHADPHPGNYRFTQTKAGPAIVLYDYGSVMTLESDEVASLLKLIEMTDQKQGDPLGLMLSLGFRGELLKPMRSKLPALCAAMLEPFCIEAKYDLSRWRRSERIADILGDDRWNFRMSGPPNFIFVMRAFRGLTYYLEKLDSPVSWGIALRPYLAMHRQALDEWRSDVPVEEPAAGFAGMAKLLKIRVTEHGATKVALTFQSDAVDDLDELMDEDLKKRVQSQGIDVAAIVRRVRQSAFVPQELFAIPETDGQRAVRVWLE